jgi:hypothetical protein
MISRAMGTRKRGHKGERDISVKTVAQGMPMIWLNLWVTAACVFCLQAGHG